MSEKMSRNKRSAKSECIRNLKLILKTHNHLDHHGARRISYETIRARRKTLIQGFTDLNKLGYAIREPKNFGERHMRVLINQWETSQTKDGGQISASTLQNRFSAFNTFCSWIGKEHMLNKGLGAYLANPERAVRSSVATEDKSWTDQKVNFPELIQRVGEKDERLVIVLKLMQAFGLRIREAISLRPLKDHYNTVLTVVHGTKGGFARIVPVETPEQLAILEVAKQIANKSNGSLIPDTYKRYSWLSRAYRIFAECGISRKHGITPHGLRHTYANDQYKLLTGVDSPVRGGQPTDYESDSDARQQIGQTLGHARKRISTAYLGGILPPKKKS